LIYKPSTGWTGHGGWWEPSIPYRLPPTGRRNIPPDLLELWVEVTVRGELNSDRFFVKWDEPTWEKKRQELAAQPASYPDFPSPGHVAVDRLHWLWKEYVNANETEKPPLARQLLERAETAGDQAEANYWRRVLAKLMAPNAATPSK
jgi:hypothetical protein